jgi:hypothetical protein
MASPAIAFAQIANECEAEGLTPKNAERIGLEIAKTFQLQADEVGILRLDKQNLVFVYPMKLHNVGSIPLNTTGSVAARTATSKRGEVINNFAQTKHTSIFEAVELDNKPKPAVGEKHEHVPHQIQKLMSVPVVAPAGVLGVIQTSHKGTSAPTAGPDFTPMDLQKLNMIATALAKCFK